jgi:hypothetical protein
MNLDFSLLLTEKLALFLSKGSIGARNSRPPPPGLHVVEIKIIK